jgi:hypothetical protein
VKEPELALLPGDEQDDVPADLAPIESMLESLMGGFAFLIAGTCEDPAREASLDMLQRRADGLEAEYELLTGRRIGHSITILEGDSCSNSKYFEQNYRAASREAAKVERLMPAIRARRSCRSGGPRNGAAPP